MIEVRLTIPECNHLLTLVDESEYDGCYFGNREQYWRRSERIKMKLQLSIKEERTDGKQTA